MSIESSPQNNEVKNIFFLPLLVLLIGGAVTVGFVMTKEEVKKKPKVEKAHKVFVRPLNKTNTTRHLVSRGNVMPSKEVTLVSEVTGKIESVAAIFDEGKSFKKDDVLLTIEARDYQLKVEEATARRDEAQQMLKLEKSKRDIAVDEWKELGQNKKVPELISNPPSLQTATSQLALAKISLEAAQRDFARCTIKAPFDGRVRKQLVSEGQVINVGTQVGEIFFTDNAEVRLPLSNSDMAHLHFVEGHSHNKVVLEYHMGNKVVTRDAVIDRVEGEVNPQSRVFHVMARVERPYETTPEKPALHVGMFVKALIEAAPLENVYVVDNHYVKNGNRIWVVSAKNTLKRRSVSIVFKDDHQVYIDQGFEEGDKICHTILPAMVDGMKVMPTLEPLQSNKTKKDTDNKVDKKTVEGDSK